MTETTEKKLEFPTLHINGTSYEMLAEGYDLAHDAIRDALEALGRIEFNARDYYVKEGSWSRAVTQMDERKRKLREVFDEIEAIMVNLYEQNQERGGK